MTPRKSAEAKPSRNSTLVEESGRVRESRTASRSESVNPQRLLSREESRLAALPVKARPMGISNPDREVESKLASQEPGTEEQLSQRFSDRKFYDQNLRDLLEAAHPGASLFALYIPPSSVVREGPEAAQGDVRVFATGEALISIPAKTRRGAPTVADLSVPVRVRGHIHDGQFVFDGADLVPKAAYYPPLVADRVTRPRRAAQ